MSVVKSIENFPWNDRKLLVACSGGVDSMVLLHALILSGRKPEVLHVNYQLRGEDSDLDEKLVVQTAKKAGLICHVHYCPQTLTKGKGINLQAAARDFRKKLFDEWKSQSREHGIVLAHHADDQTETFFLQLFRGSGTFGLGAMHPGKDGLLRPFLGIPKEEIIRYAVENNVSWREDNSNATNSYLRNVFRNQLLPELKKDNPFLDGSVQVLSSAFRDQQEIIDKITFPVAERWTLSGKLAVDTWKQFAQDEKFSLLKNMYLPFWMLPRLDELANLENTKKLLTDRFTVIRTNDHFELHDPNEKQAWDFKVEEIEFLPDTFTNDAFYADGGLIDVSLLSLEPYKRGEKIESLGIKGTQLVSKVLKDAKIPEIERSSFPVLKYNDKVIWIPGLRTGRNFLATKSSATILKITVYRIQ